MSSTLPHQNVYPNYLKVNSKDMTPMTSKDMTPMTYDPKVNSKDMTPMTQ